MRTSFTAILPWSTKFIEPNLTSSTLSDGDLILKIEELVITDTETTGFDENKDAIVQLASIRVNQDFSPILIPNSKGILVPDTFVSYVCPHENAIIDKRAEKALQITGIDMVKVWNAKSEKLVSIDFRNWLLRTGNRPRFAGFNTDFDLRMLAAMQERTGIEFPYLFDPPYCILKRAKKILKHLPSRRLVSICEYAQIPHGNAHDALADCEAARLAELYMRAL